MQQAYSSACTESGATPISRVHNQLDAPRLSLPHYGLGARGAVALSTLLPLNHSWRVFDLRDNAIGQVGALAIGAGLRGNKTLTSLELSSNVIGAKAMVRLSDGPSSRRAHRT